MCRWRQGEKDRLSDNNVTITGTMGDVRNKDVIIVDDEIATAGTISEIVAKMQRELNVRRVTVVGTHGLFTGPAVERLNAIDAIDEILITDTVPLPEERRPERLKVLGREDFRRGYTLQCPGRVGWLSLRVLAHILRPHLALQGMEASSDDRSAGR